MAINREIFEQQRRPRFGHDNPERMRLAFWEWMIRGGEHPYQTRDGGLGKLYQAIQQDVPTWGAADPQRYNAYRARTFFAPELRAYDSGPVWTFDRMGASCSELSDRRIVFVGGEHEDSYDPDFCIYNDVVVFGPADEVEIYGFPKEVFPPTDFHTATIVGDQIIIIGCLGYPETREPGRTPVYALDLAGYCMSKIETSGEVPGWISRHEAEYRPHGVITVRSGQVFEHQGRKPRIRHNVEDYALDIKSGVWSRLTSRNWLQFQISRKDRKLLGSALSRPQALLADTDEHAVLLSEDWDRARMVITGVPVTLIMGIGVIEVIIEGEMPANLASRLAEEIRAKAETLTGHPCVLEQI